MASNPCKQSEAMAKISKLFELPIVCEALSSKPEVPLRAFPSLSLQKAHTTIVNGMKRKSSPPRRVRVDHISEHFIGGSFLLSRGGLVQGSVEACVARNALNPILRYVISGIAAILNVRRHARESGRRRSSQGIVTTGRTRRRRRSSGEGEIRITGESTGGSIRPIRRGIVIVRGSATGVGDPGQGLQRWTSKRGNPLSHRAVTGWCLFAGRRLQRWTS
jgi:hypothetical protein